MKTLIQNGKIINSKFEIEDGVVVINDGKIEFVGKEYPGKADNRTYDWGMTEC